ncbi:hypothetical protein [Streptococcus suis]|uniref:hypothetical protein n=1 Tax=Streptococcus suis TaxID=1307 RepID=UPI000CF54A50|nr:hypothetical protein [Streptococcus suis]MBM7280943.1 hypothetical protein [Streptococcus suis]MBO4134446.1 hypothetical protein [Streptococcus suis]RRR58422.1 hypothetical protein EI995_04215 [Streptococcus suis]RRR65077.1 hypothetical protein EI993_00310 [Streptococcus suis]HEM3517958.1 hypothetical protein [Streptococcus suis]
MMKLLIILLAIFTFTGCSSQKSNDKPTSYDGDYSSYAAILEGNDEISFTIENGKVKGKAATGVVDERTMTFTDKDQLKSTFTYDKGELIIKKSESVVAYRKNSPAYNYINEVYAKYYQEIEPQLIKIINQNYLQFLEGNYISQYPDLEVKQIVIDDNQFLIQYINSKPNKYIDFIFDSVTIGEPNWDKDQILSIDETLLKTYENCSTIEDIMAITNFDIKLTGHDKEGGRYKIIVSYNNGSRNIVLQKHGDSKNNWIDSDFDYIK